MQRAVPAQIIYLPHGVWAMSQESAYSKSTFNLPRLSCVSEPPNEQFCSGFTSTSCSIATTKRSKGEFLHPIIVPWLLFLGTSDGQKILSSPFAGTIISSSLGSEGASTPKLLARGNTVDGRTGMLDVEVSKTTCYSETKFDTHIVCLACCKAFNGQDENEEDH